MSLYDDADELRYEERLARQFARALDDAARHGEPAPEWLDERGPEPLDNEEA